MTTEEKLKAVTEDIRDKLPRLMKLEKGCLVQSHHFDDIREIYMTHKIKGELYYLTFCKQFKQEYTLEEQIQKIIGKEPMLNDVLEWLQVLNSLEYDMQINQTASQIELANDEIIYIDLSKPYLKDQSAELINFLYELL